MAFGLIVAILLVGMLLIFLEVFLIPGTTVFGFIGGAAALIGVVLMYVYYGKGYGNITLGLTSIATIIAIVAGLKVVDSNKLAMKGEITSKVNILDTKGSAVGDRGVAITDLRPNGKAIINEHKLEVFSSGDFISRDEAVEIVKITNDKIFVAPLKP